MISAMTGESFVDRLNDGAYSFIAAHEHSLCSSDELSLLVELIEYATTSFPPPAPRPVIASAVEL